MALTAEQVRTLLESESLGDWRPALQAEADRLIKVRDGLPQAGELGDTPRNGLNRRIFDIVARLSRSDPLPPADAAAVAAKVAERQAKRATAAELHKELLSTTPGSTARAKVLDDLLDFNRALTETEGADAA
jgi:hypothetical protein